MPIPTNSSVSRNWLQSFLNSLPGYAAVLGTDYTWQAFNPPYQEEFTKLFGARPEIGASLKDSVKEEDTRNDIILFWGRALRGESFHTLAKLGPKGGSAETYRHTMGPLRDEDGNITGAFLIAEKVTELSDQQKELHLQQERFHKAFEYSGVGMALVSPEGRFMRVNQALCDIVGYSGEELTRMTFQELTHPEDLDADLLLLKELTNGEVNFYEMDKRYFHAEGHIVWVHLTGTMVPNDDGSPLFYIAQIQDITLRKMTEEQLLEARDAAIRADVAKSNFLAVMSHEIRTPMNAIIGFSDILATTQLDEEQHEWLQHIQDSGEDLLNLINNILDFSKIEAGSLEMNLEPVPLKDLVDQVTWPIRPKAEEKGLELHVEVAEDCPKIIQTDNHRLRQILLNLLGNAVKFTREGHVKLVVEPSAMEERKMLDFRVIDTGIGISEDVQGRLFQPFTQADSSTTREFGGTGLGLSICERLATAFDGRITLESQPDKGSIFTLQLPLDEGLLRLGSGIRLSPDAETTDKLTLLTGHVLLVDDTPANVTMLTHRLRRLGLEVSIARSAKEAMEVLEGPAKFDAVLTDLMMPKSDGFHLAAAVRKKFPAEDMKLVLISSLPLHLLPKRPERALFEKLLAKPVSIFELYQALVPLLRPKIADVPDAEPAGGENKQFSDFFPANILIAEDVEASRVLLLNFLKRLGYTEPRVVHDGLQCWEEYQRRPADLVLLDLHMPRMNGMEAAKKILEFQKTQEKPVRLLALTADALKEDAQMCLEAGFHGYLAKPYRMQQLKDTIAELLGAK